ncbi:hypothetical protein BJ165DRAFT_717857 [Panaeolus papilionaceus]|nr:hypothetical protein BJ165DRAFT_717857 [Panaeolus papilionaceus]
MDEVEHSMIHHTRTPGPSGDSWLPFLSWMGGQNLSHKTNNQINPQEQFFIGTIFCGICLDSVPTSDSFNLPACQHPFCNSCILTYILKKVADMRYPIPCPVCITEGHEYNIESEVFECLEIPADSRVKLHELQIAQFAVAMTCLGCKQAMHVTRSDISESRLVSCPLPDCAYRWCLDCMKEINLADISHRCKNKKFDRLMRRRGWKYCPGCAAPVQKESGCNHITVKSKLCLLDRSCLFALNCSAEPLVVVYTFATNAGN